MTNTEAAALPTTARALTVAAKRALREAGVQAETVRSHGPTMGEHGLTFVFPASADDLVAIAAAVSGLPARIKRGDSFVSIFWGQEPEQDCAQCGSRESNPRHHHPEGHAFVAPVAEDETLAAGIAAPTQADMDRALAAQDDAAHAEAVKHQDERPVRTGIATLSDADARAKVDYLVDTSFQGDTAAALAFVDDAANVITTEVGAANHARTRELLVARLAAEGDYSRPAAEEDATEPGEDWMTDAPASTLEAMIADPACPGWDRDQARAELARREDLAASAPEVVPVSQADLDSACGNAGRIEHGLPGDLAPQRDAWAAAGATHWQSVKRAGGGVITRPVVGIVESFREIEHADGSATTVYTFARPDGPDAASVTVIPGRLPVLRVLGAVPSQVAECDSLDHARRQAREIAARS